MTKDPCDGDGRATPDRRGISRRGFLTTMGTGVLSTAAAGQLAAQPTEVPDVLGAAQAERIQGPTRSWLRAGCLVGVGVAGGSHGRRPPFPESRLVSRLPVS
jgi:hypothetical protein